MTELFNRSLILEEINNLLFYRNIVSLERIFSNSDELEDVIRFFYLVRHRLGEPQRIWIRGVFGNHIPVCIRANKFS